MAKRGPISSDERLAPQYHPLWNQKAVTDKTLGSRSAYWKCPEEVNHVWEADPFNRDRQPECPFCASPPTYAGMGNSLRAMSPELVGYVHPSRNRSLQGRIIGATSILPKANRVYWKCMMAPDHEWCDSVGHILDGRDSICPYCKEEYAVVSVSNSLPTTHPDLANQVHPLNDVPAHRLSASRPGASRVKWKCFEGPDHEWSCNLHDRFNTTNSTGSTSCPCCSIPQKEASVTRNASNEPVLRSRAEPTMNQGKLLHREGIFSNARFTWKCPENPNHLWQTAIASCYKEDESGNPRVVECPFCSGRNATLQNSLAILEFRINTEWDHERNQLRGRTLTNTSPGSSYKADWICRIENCRTRWRAEVSQRTGLGEKQRASGCPGCARALNRSRVEVRTIYEISHVLGLKYHEDYHFNDGERRKSVDFICDDISLIIEVDGGTEGFRHGTDDQIDRDTRWSGRMSRNHHLLRIRDSRLEGFIVHEHEIHFHFGTHESKMREKIVIPALIHILDEVELPPNTRETIRNYIEADETEMITLADSDLYYDNLLRLAHGRGNSNEDDS